MIEKSAFFNELARRNTLSTIYRPSTATVAAVVSLLLFFSETSGPAQELSPAPQSTAPVRLSVPEAGNSGTDRASIDRSHSSGINDTVPGTQGGRASPGQWLIDDVVRDRAKLGVKPAGPRPTPAAASTPHAAPFEARVALPSPDDARAGEREHGLKPPPASTGRRPALDSGNTPFSRSVATEAEDGKPPTALLRRSHKRWNEHGASTRPDTSRALDDVANCVEAPVGQAPEGEHWYYRLDRETNRKCWYVRSPTHDESARSLVERGRRLSQQPSADPLDPTWAWWYRR